LVQVKRLPGTGSAAALAPRVSVLLPARDAAGTLTACLASLARQTFTGWECVIVDDGSQDATGRIALEAASADSRYRVITTTHQGIVGALNEGLRHCRAPLVARMDADDVMHRRRLEEQVRALEQDRTLAGVGCHVRVFPRARLRARRDEPRVERARDAVRPRQEPLEGAQREAVAQLADVLTDDPRAGLFAGRRATDES